jgi:hypothetical protein
VLTSGEIALDRKTIQVTGRYRHQLAKFDTVVGEAIDAEAARVELRGPDVEPVSFGVRTEELEELTNELSLAINYARAHLGSSR